MLQFPSPVTASSFLGAHWQKRPLFMPRGLPPVEPVIGADDLAWLATQPDVETRLVVTETSTGGTRYRVRNGPFSERQLRQLPPENWTLLVHDVEKHLPELRVYYEAAPFVPDWRIDDLLISVAAPGGSVGPHRDSYDVFLCQVSGRRAWHLAAPEDAVPARSRDGLVLLEPFESPEPIVAGPADVLYLPPGVPHWGIAADTCITCSLGMRAPTRSQLVDALREVMAEDSPGIAACSGEDEDPLYQDPDLQPNEAEPGMISPQALERAARLLGSQLQGQPVDTASLARAFGSAVTTPKEWLAPERPDQGEIGTLVHRFAESVHVLVHGMARLAWWVSPDGSSLIFVNGRSRRVGPNALVEFRQLCRERRLACDQCATGTKGGLQPDFMNWLIGAGTFDLGS